MSVACVIPARIKSTRFPAKALANWRGKTILQHTWERACLAKQINQLMIATDSTDIFATAQQFGAQVIMTSEDHLTGSDRVAQAIEQLDSKYVINLQLDEPQIDPALLDALAVTIQKHPDADCVTAIGPNVTAEQAGSKSCVKCTTDHSGKALYFSRHLPYGFRHIGLYAYKREALLKFVQLPPGKFELLESLEQLRMLEAGMSIYTIESSYQGISVDTPEDLECLNSSPAPV